MVLQFLCECKSFSIHQSMNIALANTFVYTESSISEHIKNLAAKEEADDVVFGHTGWAYSKIASIGPEHPSAIGYPVHGDLQEVPSTHIPLIK